MFVTNTQNFQGQLQFLGISDGVNSEVYIDEDEKMNNQSPHARSKREIQARNSNEYFDIGSFTSNFLKTITYRQFTDTAKL